MHADIEGGIAEILIETHKYNETQHAFQKRPGAESAVIPPIVGREYIKYLPALDLKSAYNTERRKYWWTW